MRETLYKCLVAQLGDLVLHSLNGAIGVFLIQEAGEEAQLFYPVYEDALRHATQMAQRLRVDVWTAATPTSIAWQRVVCYRAPTS